MAQFIQNLPQPQNYSSNNSWILIEHQDALYKVKSSVFLDSMSIQSEYIDSQSQLLTFQDSSMSFSRDHLFSLDSSFMLNLEFSGKIKFAGVTLIKNAGENICKLLTFEGVSDIAIDSTSELINLSYYKYTNIRHSNIVGSLSLSSSNSSISINQLKLQNVTVLPAIDSCYVCAKIQSRTINA